MEISIMLVGLVLLAPPLLAARIPRPRYYDREGNTDYLIEREY